MENEFKVGDRVRVLSLYGSDERIGVKVGMTGVVSLVGSVVFVKLDGLHPPEDRYGEVKADGSVSMYFSQLEPDHSYFNRAIASGDFYFTMPYNNHEVTYHARRLQSGNGSFPGGMARCFQVPATSLSINT